MLMPARIPVTVEKNRPKILKKFSPSMKLGPELLRKLNWLYPVTPCTGSKNDISTFGRKEGNVLFNDALNTFYLRLYGVRHMVKDHSDSEKGNLLPPHRLLFPINNSKGSFICTIPQTG